MATLKVTVHLWTDETPEGVDCWNFGMVHVPVRANKANGLRVSGSKGVLFNKPEELTAALAKALEQANVSVAAP